MTKSNILVVDDSISNLLLIKDILSSNPEYNIITENNSENVLAQMNSHHIDLILLDIMMPNIDGYEVCKRIKQDAGYKDIPIIFLTAKIDETSLLRGFELGGADYIKKPFLISELMARVKTHLQIKKTNEKLKNELFKHSITQQSLILSQNELTIRNNIAQYFLSDDGDEVYPKLLEEVLKYISMDYGTIGYLSYTSKDHTNIQNLRLICPTIYSNTIETDRNYIFTMDEIGDIALAAIRRQSVLQKGSVSRLFFTKADVACMIAVPIIFQNSIVGIIACAAKESDNADNALQKLQKLVGFIAPIINNRIAVRENNLKLAQSITEAQELERKRFAKDVHDGLGSYLTSLATYITILKSGTLDSSENSQMLDEMGRVVRETANEARNIANNLIPDVIEKNGLEESIHQQFNRLFIGNHNTALQLDCSNYIPTNNKEIETELYRIASELMNNAFKYAQCTKIEIQISSRDNSHRLTYRDNGIGFDIKSVKESIKWKRSSGLRNITERAIALGGKSEIKSASGKGMYLEVTINE
jgi:signal transduction histidine kinase/DNA-binding response OmpR family regulator